MLYKPPSSSPAPNPPKTQKSSSTAPAVAHSSLLEIRGLRASTLNPSMKPQKARGCFRDRGRENLLGAILGRGTSVTSAECQDCRAYKRRRIVGFKVSPALAPAAMSWATFLQTRPDRFGGEVAWWCVFRRGIGIRRRWLEERGLIFVCSGSRWDRAHCDCAVSYDLVRASSSCVEQQCPIEFPTNILVNTNGQVKICDFGVSGNLVAIPNPAETG
ncbi:hypothetical protein B0T21DRAFT_115934 [Apiosordaria backusii]|uniref:Protein kinase domain-containing protein n=1 Tax=Apiosordaria backusii TaxID=314023 RepID=A0AA39ZPL8_9PEZI|nr:hypothetical protein B0T21DRAFT_115934 [Apiosordaria backusii]